MELSPPEKRTPKVSYARRATGGRVRIVAYIEDELAEYAIRFCDANKQSMSSLFNDLLRMLKDEV